LGLENNGQYRKTKHVAITFNIIVYKMNETTVYPAFNLDF